MDFMYLFMILGGIFGAKYALKKVRQSPFIIFYLGDWRKFDFALSYRK